MDKMREIVVNWDFMRILRLVLGSWVIYSSIIDAQPMLGILGGVFVLQALLNIGCCGSSGCKIPNNPNNQPKNTTGINDIYYEEIS